MDDYDDDNDVDGDYFVTLGLRAMVNTLLRSLKLLSDVLVLFLFFLGVMALIGLQLFSGELRNKCVLNTPVGNNSSSLQERALNESKTSSFELIASVVTYKSSNTIPAFLGGGGEGGEFYYLNETKGGFAGPMQIELPTQTLFWTTVFRDFSRTSITNCSPFLSPKLLFCQIS